MSSLGCALLPSAAAALLPAAPAAEGAMQLTAFDWLIVVVSIIVSFLPAIVLAKRAGSSTAEFFTSGQAAPWWLVGVSRMYHRER